MHTVHASPGLYSTVLYCTMASSAPSVHANGTGRPGRSAQPCGSLQRAGHYYSGAENGGQSSGRSGNEPGSTTPSSIDAGGFRLASQHSQPASNNFSSQHPDRTVGPLREKNCAGT